MHHFCISRLHIKAANTAPEDIPSSLLFLHWDAALQVKPFISEAHVFNDAGLSFDVWPPRTGSPAAHAAPKSIAKDVADNSSHHFDPMDSRAFGTLHPEDHACFADFDTIADQHKYLVTDDIIAVGNVAGLRNGGSVSAAAAGKVQKSDMNISRGYLLALKLWEEVVATVKTIHTSSKPSAAE